MSAPMNRDGGNRRAAREGAVSARAMKTALASSLAVSVVTRRPFSPPFLHAPPVGIVDEGEPLHAAVVGLLLELDALLLEPRRRGVDVVAVEGHVPEAVLVLVAGVVLEILPREGGARSW